MARGGIPCQPGTITGDVMIFRPFYCFMEQLAAFNRGRHEMKTGATR